MNAFYLLLGSEGALADRALAKLQAEFKEEKAEITTIDASAKTGFDASVTKLRPDSSCWQCV